MATKRIEIQDDKGNIYHPETDAKSVQYNNTTLDKVLDEINTNGSSSSSGSMSVPNKNLIYNSNFLAWEKPDGISYAEGYSADYWKIIKSNKSTLKRNDALKGGMLITIYKGKTISDIDISFDMKDEDVDSLVGRKCSLTVKYSTSCIPSGDTTAFRIISGIGTITCTNGTDQIAKITGTFAKLTGYGKGVVEIYIDPTNLQMDDTIKIDYIKFELGDPTPYVEDDSMAEIKKGYSYIQSFPNKVLYCVNSKYLLGFTFPEKMYTNENLKVSVNGLKTLSGSELTATITVPDKALHSYGIDYFESSTNLTAEQFYIVDVTISC